MMKLFVTRALVLLLWYAGAAYPQSEIWMHWSYGRFAEMEKAAQARIKTPADATASNLTLLCFAYSRLKRYNKLFPCIEQLEARIRAGDATYSEFMNFATDLTPLPNMLRSTAYIDFGEYAKALETGKAALQQIRDTGSALGILPPIAYRIEILSNLALASGFLGDRQGAETYRKALQEVDVPFIGAALYGNLKENSIARIYMAMGQCDKALERLKEEHQALVRAIGNLFLSGGGDSLDTLHQLPKMLMTGKCLLETGKLAEARGMLDQLLSHKRVADQGDVYWIALFERGRIAELEGKAGEAMEYYRRAIEIIEQQRSSISTEAGKIGFVGDKQQLYARMVVALFARERHGEALDYVERSKSRALVDMLASKKDFAVRGPEAARTRVILAQIDTADHEARVQDITLKSADSMRTLQVSQADLRSVAPELSSLVTVTSASSEELRRLIAADENLLEYYYQGDDLFVFIVNKDGIRAIKLDGAGLAPAVRRFRTEIESPQSNRYQVSATALYQRLIQPVESALTARKLLIVAHGALHYLPFNALQREDGSHLMDHYSVRHLPSASVLKFLRPPRPGQQAGMLVFGNPDLNDRSLDLAFAEDEARAITALFRESKVLVRQNASETNFKEAAPLFRRIHLATHGKFLADSPLDSGLYLARDAANDGVLRVSELYSMSLDADLVTLSACETGLGKVNNGDDVVGLTRGFLYAGSRLIISSLWSVDDRSTAVLMTAFYQNLLAADKREALRQAQIKVRGAHPHPFFWAAFQLTGRDD
jgi:CHAT domain-containing protein